ncbi:TaqI-like C-terminal specificity domain-containing protein [Flavobacterium sp.]|uniref:TaqI-like C-terminal specificity domain-containing protein n=1 Tax=Flavobacterium sp. TaxID=239 RepID=UPI0022C06491|nr:TaqI-like C-terminal specificity domain-containing protein [Flavobacterium sp.]MCZ8168621.1 hypothetical protein [Flavobacterium sp.]MCZ8297263.1 hypothetical protein [Flavobacterium sp.]
MPREKLCIFCCKHSSVFVRQQGSACGYKNADSWVILTEIEQRIKEKIERIGTPLKDWDIQINYGIKTGYNEAFIIDGAKRKELIEQDPKSEEIIRPILRGRDIKRYGYDFGNLWLINTHNGIKESGINAINVEEYPAVKKHLDNFWVGLEKRADQGQTPYNLRNCAYMDDFSKQKIAYIEIMTDNPDDGYDFPSFTFDTEKCIVLNTAYIISGKVDELKYILGILNSKVGRILVKFYVVQLQQRQFRMLNQYVVNFPIPKNRDFFQISRLVDKIINGKKEMKDTKSLDKKVNEIVYKLFDFSSQEIDFIENL